MSVRLRILNRALRLNLEYWQNHKEISPELFFEREQSISHWIPRIPSHIHAKMTSIEGVCVQQIIPADTINDRVLLYLHGGGYVAGSPNSTHRDYIWRIAEAAKSQVWAVNYRKAPEHPFPSALDDAHIVYERLLKQYAPGNIAIVGDSAGGGLALSLVLKLKDEGAPLPAAISVVSPWTDLTCSGKSLIENGDTEVMVPEHLLLAVAKLYAKDYPLNNPYLSPLFAEFHDFPPTQILVSEAEILLDDSRRLFKKMAEAQVQVELTVEENLPHVWPVFARLLPESRKTIAEIGAFLSRHFDQSKQTVSS